jgi:hypothetical protein
VIRQAHTYLVGAVGGATLIAIAIVFFVLLVSAQVFRDWPIAALGDGDGESAAVSAGQPAAGADDTAGEDAGVGGADAAGGGRRADADEAGTGSDGDARSVAGQEGVVAFDGGGAEPGGPADAGAGGGSGSAGSPQPASSPGTSGSTGSSSSGGGGGGGAGSGGDGGGGASGDEAPTTSSQVTETVNDTVSQVDESVLGGTLDNTGVTAVTEGVVKGVAGPESAVGKVVDEAVGAVGGLLGDKR